MASTRGRQVVVLLTNKSGGSVAAGDLVVLDSSNDTAFTTTTTGRAEVTFGVAQETIANNATGRVLTHGYAALLNVPSSVTRGHYIQSHTVAKQATGNATRQSGSFGQFLTGGTTPTGLIWGQSDQTASGGGGGSLTQAYVGYNTIGGSTETDAVNSAIHAKSVTLANDCLITSIGAYLDAAVGTYMLGGVCVMSDNSGTPDKVIAAMGREFQMSTAGGVPRWVEIPLGVWFVAGTYWIVIRTSDTGGSNLAKITYDGSGSDRTATGSFEGFYDWGKYGTTASPGRKYSMRANTIR